MSLILTQLLVLVEMWALLLNTKCAGGKKHPTRNVSRTATRIGRILSMNCFLKQVIELRKVGKISRVGKSGRRCKQLLDNRKKQDTQN
jgi:hypothetical protein